MKKLIWLFALVLLFAWPVYAQVPIPPAGGGLLPDGTTFTVDVTPGSIIQGVYESVPTTLSNNERGAIGITDDRAVRTVVEGSVTTSAQKNVNDVADAVGVPALAVRDDATTTLTEADADFTNIRTNARGAVWVSLETALSASIDSVKLGDGTFTQYIDPCQRGAKTFVIISQTSGTQLLTGTSSMRTYICSIQLISATAQNVSLVSGTGSVCATSTGGLMGGATAATGWNFTAGSGVVVGSGGFAVGKSDTDADNVCLLQSSSGQISGNLSYVVAAN